VAAGNARLTSVPDLEELAERVAALEVIVADLAEPEFMSGTRADAFRNTRGVLATRLTHLPTGVMVEAMTRAEAVAKLGRAIERHAQRRAEAPGA
jgi:hypothetical protein